MVKRIIITVTHTELHQSEGTWTYFVPMIDAYSKIHNIDFQNILLKTTPDGRHFSWSKIPVLHKFIDVYDEILFISEYSTIINNKVNVFEYIKTATHDKKWVRDQSIKPILYTLTDKSEQCNPLTGIFLLDCTNKQYVKDFLNAWWNDTDSKYLQNYPYDQHILTTWRNNVKKASLIQVIDVWSVQEFDKDQVFIQLTTAYKNIQVYEAKRYMFRMLNKKQSKVGIFVYQTNYYSNGAVQNCIFIKHSLEAAGYDVDLLIQYNPSKPTVVDPQIPYVYKMTEDYSQYKFILYGSFVPLKEVRDKIKSLGIRTAMFHPMNSYDAIHNNHFIHDLKTSTPLFEELFHTFADEIWLVHHHEPTYKSLLEIQNKHKVPVRVVPMSWSPLFTLYNGTSYMYKPNSTAEKINLVIIKPNSSYWKSSLMPLVIAERFYNEYKRYVNKIYLIGNLCDQANKMIENLSIAKDSKLHKLGRMQINDILKYFCFTENNYKVAFISHNIQCPLNYAYFDAMNVGIPFVHNSKQLEMRGMGYMYTNVQEGVKQLEKVLISHDSAAYIKPIQTELSLINPYNENIVRVFENLVENKHQDVEVSIISTGNSERLEFMKKQFTDISFPYKYSIFNAHTPENSIDYLNAPADDYMKGFTDKEIKMYQCGVRSHVDALYNCIQNSSAEYFLIIEDDVALRTDINIKGEIKRYISLMKTHPDIHYISLSYRPLSSLDKDALIHTALDKLANNDSDLYWGFEKMDTPIVWGAQAYLISRYYANKFVNLFKKNTVLELSKSVEEHYNLHTIKYSRRAPQLIIDALMPIFFNQAIVYPMLGVERYFSHSISSNLELERLTCKYIEHVKIPYYKIIIPKVSTYIISTGNPKRVDYMKKQLNAIQIPFPYTFFNAYTTESSSDFIDMKREEPAQLLFCMRSHISALELALRSESEYFLILEDDVAFQTNINLKEKLHTIISKLKAHPDIHYVSLSYLPAYADNSLIASKLHLLEHKDDDIYWGFDKDKINFTIWGSQAYIISREYAKKLVSIFKYDKISLIDKSYNEYLSTHKTYANKAKLLPIDCSMPYVLNQAILYPKLCIETYFDDSYSSNATRVHQWNEYKKSVSCEYYIPA
jgi:GR25 family glycosyltransferase involved in LPS biosynthesis